MLFLNLNTKIQAEGIKKEPIIKEFEKIGYKKMDGVVNEFEKENNVNVCLPKKFPIQITHKFAKIDEENKLQLYYLNNNNKQVIKVFITLDKDYFNEPRKEVILQNKTRAYIKATGKIVRIDFVKNNLAYSISYHKIKSPQLTEHNLISIANSIK